MIQSRYKLSSRFASAYPAELSYILQENPPLGPVERVERPDGVHYHWSIDGGDACATFNGTEFELNIERESALPQKRILMDMVSVALKSGDPEVMKSFASIIKEVWCA